MEIWNIRWSVEAIAEVFGSNTGKPERPARQDGFKRRDIKEVLIPEAAASKPAAKQGPASASQSLAA